MFLTHGHEDHVGGLPHLLGEIPVPVYATPMTLAPGEPAEVAAKAADPGSLRAAT